MKKLRLLMAFCTLLLGWSNANAQTDVTATYISNAGFESCTALTTNQGTGSNVDYTANGWTASGGVDWCCGAVVSYGGAGQVNSASAPSADNAGNSGNALGISVGWGGTVTYKSANVTLPAGYYYLSAYAYNNNDAAAQFASKLGFVPTEGDAFVSNSSAFSYGKWIKDGVVFYLSTATEGYFQVGGTAVSGGSGANAKVFFDNLTLIYSDKQMDYTGSVALGKTDWAGTGTYGSVTTRDGRTTPLAEYYESSAAGTKMSQNITGLRNGIYELTVYATSHNAWGNHSAALSGDADDVAYIFAAPEGGVTLKQFFTARKDGGMSANEPFKVTISGITVEQGSMNIGLALDKSNMTEWQTIQIYSLTRTAGLDLSGLVTAYETALANAKAVNQSAKMKATVLTALQGAISTYDEGNVDDQDADALETAAAALMTATDNATASISIYSSINTAISAYGTQAAALDESGVAAYDASGVTTKYNNGTYETLAEAVTELQAAYATAVKSQTTVGSDWTGLIINPSFETNDLSGWTNTGGMWTQGNSSFALKNGTYYVEYWQPNGTKGVKQTLNDMPSGVYRLTVAALARNVTSAKVFANGINQAITIKDGADTYSVDFACDADADVEIGFEAVCTGADASWICVDNFTLSLVSSGLPDVEAVTGKMNATVAAAQTTAVETYEANRTIANYNTAVAAIAAAQASKDAYASGKAALDKAKDIMDNTNVYTAAAYETFNSSWTTGMEKYNAETWTTEEANGYKNTTFGTGWRSTASVDDFLISAWDVNARKWDSYHINTWSTTGDSGNPNMYVPCFEYWTGDASTLGDKTMTATLSGFAPGATYKVSVLVCMGVNTGVDASTAPTGATLQLNDGTPVSICTGSRIASTRFYEGTFEATGTVGLDGNLVIELDVASTNASWITWRNVTYTKTGEGVTIGSTGWTTFSSPYALNLSSMTASAGDVTAYYASATSAESVTVLPTESSAVQAGEGILLKGTAGATITIPVVVSGDAISGNLMVGCPTATNITSSTPNYETCYVLGVESEKAVFQNVKKYVDEHTTLSIPAGKAYLNATASNGARSMRIVFGDITGVANVEAAAEAEVKDGKYLENGKIVIVKNGKKFNASGAQMK